MNRIYDDNGLLFFVNNLVDKLLLAVAVFAPFALASSFLRIIELQTYGLFFIQTVVSITVFITMLLRKKLTLNIKKWILAVCLFLIGLAGLVTFGFSLNNISYFIASLTVATIFSGRKAGLLVFLLGLVSLIVTAFLITQMDFHIVKVSQYQIQVSFWISYISGYVLIAALLISATSIINEHLVTLLLDLRLNSSKLEESNIQLQERNEELIAIEEELNETNHKLVNNEILLRESEAKYMTMVNASADHVYTLDISGYFTAANQSLIHFLNIDASELIGQHFFTMCNKSDSQEIFSRYLNNIKAEQPPLEFKTSFTKGDTCLNFSVMITPLFDIHGLLYGFLGTNHDITEIMNSYNQIHTLAYFDHLTGLPNRLHFKETVESQIELSKGIKNDFVLYHIDIDYFKRLNDTLGHEKGDQILKRISAKLDEINTLSIMFARTGGDEFSIITRAVQTPEQILDFSKKIHAVINTPILFENAVYQLKCSVGIARFPLDGLTFDELFKSVDIALNYAKSIGRNTEVMVYDDIKKEVITKYTLEQELMHSLERDELSVMYQPIILLADNKIRGVEALMRWNNTKFGSVPPSKFIPIMEQTGFIYIASLFLLEKACREIGELIKENHQDLVLSVNMSAYNIMTDNFIDDLKGILNLTQFNPENLEIEITESIFINDFNKVEAKFIEIINLGVNLSLDDFGSEYSSIRYISQIPIHTLKIDRSFIETITSDSKMIHLVEAIIQLASKLNIEVVSEGIETFEQSELLKNIHCQLGQGYLFSKPMDLNKLVTFVLSNDHS